MVKQPTRLKGGKEKKQIIETIVMQAIKKKKGKLKNKTKNQQQKKGK